MSFDRSHSGQVAVYLAISLAAVFLLTLLAVDVFLSVRTKDRLQNGGDAAALAAAHRQGEIINEIGRLNIEHIKAALNYKTNECAAIGLKQRRLALVEPVSALKFASDAAIRNGLERNEAFSDVLREHLNYVRMCYAVGDDGAGGYLEESYPGAWHEYSIAIENAISEGLAAGADNIEFYTVQGSHPLFDPEFYYAIAGEDWCWFFFNDQRLLDGYRSFHDWGYPTFESRNSVENSEIFSLHLSATTNSIMDKFSLAELIGIANKYGGMNLKIENYIREDGSEDRGLLDETGWTWFFFSPSHWDRWFDGKRLHDDEDENYEYPIVGTIKEEYNVRGCAAVCRTRKDDTPSFTTDTTHLNIWSAAAKPFGTVETLGGDVAPVTALKNFVVPCMRDVRLVSIDSVASSNLATADPDWFFHVRSHLKDYLYKGPKNNGDCWFCAQLKKWEHPQFHHRGTKWLKYHSGQCIRPVDGGPAQRGGTSHGH